MVAVTPKAGMKPGVDVTIGGALYIAPPLTFGSLRRMSDLKPSATYAHDLLAFVLLESLQRNYEGVNALWLNETLEASEVNAAAEAELEIMRRSGLIKPGEEKASGEAEAVTG